MVLFSGGLGWQLFGWMCNKFLWNIRGSTDKWRKSCRVQLCPTVNNFTLKFLKHNLYCDFMSEQLLWYFYEQSYILQRKYGGYVPIWEGGGLFKLPKLEWRMPRWTLLWDTPAVHYCASYPGLRLTLIICILISDECSTYGGNCSKCLGMCTYFIGIESIYNVTYCLQPAVYGVKIVGPKMRERANVSVQQDGVAKAAMVCFVMRSWTDQNYCSLEEKSIN